MPDKYASMDSQLGYAECEVEDTEEMSALRRRNEDCYHLLAYPCGLSWRA